MIKQIKFASIPVRDQDRSLEFFTGKLGFAVATDQPFDGKQRWIELKLPGAETRLVLFTPDGHAGRIGSLSNITFMADDVEQTYEQLSGKGVTFSQKPQKAPWGSYAVFEDPDGNQFVLSSR